MAPLQEITQYYHELHPEAFIKQPWNTYSSLVFFLPVIHYLYLLRGQYRRYGVLVAILPLLFLNGLGSTLWHANNGGTLYGLLDVLPPLVMLIVLCIYFWRIVTGHWGWGVLLVVAFLVGNGFLLYSLQNTSEENNAVNWYYLLNGLMIGAPTLGVLLKTQWHRWPLIVYALVFIGLALLFRLWDSPDPQAYRFDDTFPMGTHWLWHVTSMFAILPLGYYLMHLRQYLEKK